MINFFWVALTLHISILISEWFAHFFIVSTSSPFNPYNFWITLIFCSLYFLWGNVWSSIALIFAFSLSSLFGTSIPAFSNAFMNFFSIWPILHFSILMFLSSKHSFIEWTFSSWRPNSFLITLLFNSLYFVSVKVFSNILLTLLLNLYLLLRNLFFLFLFSNLFSSSSFSSDLLTSISSFFLLLIYCISGSCAS